jgi:dipeptidyl aminopeptidase/acylaminoacyl peptidase
MMRKCGIIAMLFVALGLGSSVTSVEAAMDHLPRLPGAMLLLGYPPFNLAVTAGNKTTKLQEEAKDGVFISPSISADGRIVATAHRIPGDPFTRSPSLMVSTYSMTDDKWTDHKELVVAVGSVAISPDGSELACVTRKTPGASSGLRILDLRSGKVTAGPEMPERASSGISWSPDGGRIAFDKEANRSAHPDAIPLDREIYILNVVAGTVSRVGEGLSPSWSPSGAWIAFIDTSSQTQNEYRVSLMHPDGTGSRVVMTFRSEVVPNLKPVWSPDSKTLLINESRNPDKDTWNIYVVDLATLKSTRKFEDTPPVFAWVAAK